MSLRIRYRSLLPPCVLIIGITSYVSSRAPGIGVRVHSDSDMRSLVLTGLASRNRVFRAPDIGVRGQRACDMTSLDNLMSMRLLRGSLLQLCVFLIGVVSYALLWWLVCLSTLIFCAFVPLLFDSPFTAL